MLEVTNLHNGAILPHSVCLLRVTGTQKDATCAAIHNQSDNTHNAGLCRINGGGFNAVIRLVKGENDLRIICGTEETSIKVIYKPTNNHRYIRLIYLTCMNEDKFQGPKDMDRSPSAAIRKIQAGSLILQAFTAETLASEGLGRRTFEFETDSDGTPMVHNVQLPITIREAHKLSEERLWEAAALHILSSDLADNHCKYVAFFNGTRFSNPDKKPMKSEAEVMAHTAGHVSLGGGGLALVGSGALYTWCNDITTFIDAISNTTPIDTNTLMDFSATRGTWGACFGTHLGSVLHELAHTLDLGHTPHGIMARGFEDLHVFFTTTKFTSDYLPQSPHHSSIMRQSMSSSLIKESVTFSADFVRRIPLDNINMTVEPPKEPIASSGVYSPPVLLSRRYPNKIPSHSHSGSNLAIDDPINVPRSVCRAGTLLNAPSPHISSAMNNNKNIDVGLKCRAFWARSSALILAFHKWLNVSNDGDIPELKGSVLCSSAGLRVVELRDLHTMAFHHWEFVKRSPPAVFHLPWAQVCHWPVDSHIEVVAQDNQGNLLKGSFIPRPL